MDPFVIISFGKKTFRTRAIRHCLNPLFNERLIFQVMSNEKNYSISFNVYDRDKISSNDFVAQAALPLADLISNAPTPDPETGLYRLPDPWRDADHATRPKAKRQDSVLGRILSRSNSSTNLTKVKGNNNGKSGSATTLSSGLPSTSTLELSRSLSSTSLSDLSGIFLSFPG
jgi:phosphatidylserine decarboxylase